MKVPQEAPGWHGSILSHGDKVSFLRNTQNMYGIFSRKADVPWTFMILGELGHELNRSGKACSNCWLFFFFSSTWHLAPLIFRMVGRISLSSLYIHIAQGHYTQTLYFSMPLLYKASFGHVIPKLLFLFFFFFFQYFALDFDFTPKRPVHTVQLPQAFYQAVLTTRLYESSNSDW